MSKLNGSKWIRKCKRLAIYMRDGMACAYCKRGIEDGVVLTLDHLTPRCAGGGNEETNLITCCLSCNSSRQDKDWRTFCTTPLTVRFIENQRIKSIDDLRKMAKCIIGQRENFKSAVAYATATS